MEKTKQQTSSSPSAPSSFTSSPSSSSPSSSSSSSSSSPSSPSPSLPFFSKQQLCIEQKFEYLNNTSSVCCVVNKDGEILFTNRAWSTFVLENETSPTPRPINNNRYWLKSQNQSQSQSQSQTETQNYTDIDLFFQLLPALFEEETKNKEEDGKEGKEGKEAVNERKRKREKVVVYYPYSSDLYECEVKAKAISTHSLQPSAVVIEHNIMKLKKKQRKTNSQIQTLKTVNEISDLFPIISLLSSHCCLLDLNGKIIYTNPAWNVFCVENGGVSHHYVGTNYLCLPSKNPSSPFSDSTLCGGEDKKEETKEAKDEIEDLLADDDEIANEIQEGFSFIEGLRRLIDGHTLQEIQLVYPCHSPAEKRFFLATATNLFIGEKRVIFVSHELLSKSQKRQKSPEAASELSVVFHANKKKKENIWEPGTV